MRKETVLILRLALGVTAAVAISYAIAWPLSYITPVFAFMFLVQPRWIGFQAAVKLLLMLGLTLIIGVAISEFFLGYPLLCVSFYALILFLIYYYGTPEAPPLSILFMTISVTIIPITSFSGAGVASAVAGALLVSMAGGLVVAGSFHLLLPLPPVAVFSPSAAAAKQEPAPAQAADQAERVRLAFVSTFVALITVTVFFAFNLSSYALALVYVCMMASTPSKNASAGATRSNFQACLLGGVAIVLVYNFLLAIPTLAFLLAVTLFVSLIFARRIFAGGPHAAAYTSGFSTFLILLGSSTGVGAEATANFYLRIAQIVAAGLISIAALSLFEILTRPQGILGFLTGKLRETLSRRTLA
jgi:hypothetical protein